MSNPKDFVLKEGDIKIVRHAAARETMLHESADKHLKDMTVALRYAFAVGRKSVAKALPKVKSRAEAEALMRDVPDQVEEALNKVLPGTLLRTVQAGGRAGLAMLLRKLRVMGQFRAAAAIDIEFDAENEAAAKWARKHATKLASDLSKTSREAIKEAIARVFEGGKFDELYDEILDAVGDEMRADLIARTEIMIAAHEGQREAWEQAKDEGLLTGKERRVWITVEGACPLCEELEGETAPLDGEYPGGIEGPPLHPRCRCTEGIQ